MASHERLEDALGDDLSAQYQTLCAHVADVHRDVTAGAAASDGGLLTDHGPAHIQTVIARASRLAASARCDLSDYEIFLLLAAIHLHDVGNMHGRAGHQLKAADVAVWLGPSIGRDAIVRRQIVQIASAHTAGDSPDKDTIGKLQPEVHILNRPIRPRLLAAILRFADELADDRSRASRYMHETRSLPASSEVFHAFAYALHSVVVDHEAREVQLHFDIERDSALRKMGKKDTEVFLLDEILSRSAKLHRERAYAMLYMRDFIPIEAIRVFVEVYGDGLDAVERLGYRLADRGYPEELPQGIYGLVPELLSYGDWEGAKVTGATLAHRLEGRTSNDQADG